MKAAIYLRVSTKQQDEETQLPDLLERIKIDNATYNENLIFSDKLSGTKDSSEREGLAKLLTLTKNDVDIIYIWEISRLSRNPEYFDELILHFKNQNINLCFLKPTPLYLFDINTGEELLHNTIALKLFSTFALWEIKQKAQRTQRGKKEKLKSGVVNADVKPLYGYFTKDGQTYINDEKVLSEVEGFRSEKEVVESIFKMYAEGKTPMYIKRLLDQLNIPSRNSLYGTKDTYNYKGTSITKSDLKWSKTTIGQMLDNTKYIGKGTVKLKFDTGKKEVIIDKNGKSKAVPVYRYETIEVTRPAIISEALFQKVQERKHNGNVNPKVVYNKEMLLRGIIKCGRCGDNFSTSTHNGNNSYLCADRNKKRSAIQSYKGCTNGSIYQEKADSIVWGFVKQFYEQEQRKELKTGGLESLQKTIQNKEQLLIAKDKEYNKLNKQEIEIGKRIATVPVNLMEGFLLQADKIAKEKEYISKEMASIRKEINTIQIQIENIQNIELDNIEVANIDDNFELKFDAVRRLIKEVLVYKINNKVSLLQVVFNTIDSTGDNHRFNILYYIWYRKVMYLPNNLYKYCKEDNTFAIDSINDGFSFEVKKKYLDVNDIWELDLAKVPVCRVPDKIKSLQTKVLIAYIKNIKSQPTIK